MTKHIEQRLAEFRANMSEFYASQDLAEFQGVGLLRGIRNTIRPFTGAARQAFKGNFANARRRLKNAFTTPTQMRLDRTVSKGGRKLRWGRIGRTGALGAGVLGAGYLGAKAIQSGVNAFRKPRQPQY